MTDDPTNCPPHKPMTRGLAWAGVATAAALPAIVSVLPASAQPWNVSVIGAVGLFAAARLSFNRAFLFVALAIIAKDAAVYFALGMDPYPLSWVYFLGYVAVGYAFLRRTDSPLTIAGGALGASLLFFTASNFVSWLEQAAPYGYSLAGLADCYAAGVPFFRGTIVGDLFFSGVLFGAHAVLSRAYFPAERVVPVLVTTAEARS
ncbi:DUF6580 family putative transport protein [Gemmata sp.]|uniref:DUF6580 family putative transport protein n=1 Tax=Gemmata sp. TaxID=1914242 RepID=UPI003F71A019